MDGNDIFGIFDQNVPFELRLRDAIINKLVVPFKYYGIRDELIEYRYQEIIIFLVVGMIMMAGMFVVTVIEGMCDSLIEKIREL